MSPTRDVYKRQGQDGAAGIDVAQDHDLLLRDIEGCPGAPAQGGILKRDEQALESATGHLRLAAGGLDGAAQPLQAHADVCLLYTSRCV